MAVSVEVFYVTHASSVLPSRGEFLKIILIVYSNLKRKDVFQGRVLGTYHLINGALICKAYEMKGWEIAFLS